MSLDKGLSNSNYGIIVLSNYFFDKDWTEYELKSLNAIELGNEGIILPIWHNVGRNEVLKFSPYLADKLAISASKITIPEIAIKILDVIRPDLSENYHTRNIWEEFGKPKGNEEIHESDGSDISKKVLFRHKTLPHNLLVRIRLIRASLLSGYLHTFEFWVDGFKCNLHPEWEIEKFERIAYSYLEVMQSIEVKQVYCEELFTFILGYYSGQAKYVEANSKLPREVIGNAIKICKNSVPYFEPKVNEHKWGKAHYELDIYERLEKNVQKNK
jgi:hypothetical protein